MDYVNIFEKGPGHVLAAIDEHVNWVFGDWPDYQGISSSDVKHCVASIISQVTGLNYWENFKRFNPVHYGMIEDRVRHVMREVLP